MAGKTSQSAQLQDETYSVITKSPPASTKNDKLLTIIAVGIAVIMTSFVILTLMFAGEPDVSHIQLPSAQIAVDNDVTATFFRNAAQKELEYNPIVTPLNDAFTLSILANGATDETAEALKLLVGPKFNERSELNTMRKSMNELYSFVDGSRIRLFFGQGIWSTDGVKPPRDFRQRMKLKYDAGMSSGSLASHSMAEYVNNWAARESKNRIRYIVDESDPERNRYAALVTSVTAIEADWLHAPVPSHSADADFFALNGERLSVRAMFFAEQKRQTLRGDDVVGVRLGMGSDRIGLYVFQPVESSLPALIQSLNAQQLKGWIDRMAEEECSVRLPVIEHSYWRDARSDIVAGAGHELFDETNSWDEIFDDGLLYPEALHQFVRITLEDVNLETSIEEESEKPAGLATFKFLSPFIYVLRDDANGLFVAVGAFAQPGNQNFKFLGAQRLAFDGEK